MFNNVWRLFLLALCMVSVLASCNSKYKKQTDIFKKLMAENNVKLQDQPYLIIPVDGCGKCVDTSENFLRKHLSHPGITFILTSEYGLKSIKTRFRNGELDASNIVIDTKGDFIRERFTSGFISLVSLNKGNIQRIETFQPDEVAGKLGTLSEAIKQ